MLHNKGSIMEPNILTLALTAVVSVALAAFATWLIAARRTTTQTLRAVTAETTLAAERAAHQQNIAAMQESEQRLRDTFAGLSQQALKDNSTQFLQLAQERLERQQQAARSDLGALVDPLKVALEQQRTNLQRIEQARENAYGSIEAQLKRMTLDQEQLQLETANLVKALRQPQVRGRWGELQLRRVVELAGMSQHCDFIEQQSISGEDGARQRPDVQVCLPNQRVIVIDAKVPLSAYLDALEATNEPQRIEHLQNHARQVRHHIVDMAKRDYQRNIDGVHDFLVLFIPGDAFYHAALEHDHELMEYAFSKGIILATPTTLIGLLKAVALGWREARLAANAQCIKEEGEIIYKHLNTLAGHIADLGKSLGKSVEYYNKSIGSMERNLLNSARRLHDMEVSAAPLAEIRVLDESIRPFSKAELLPELHDERFREQADAAVPAA
jgi:DNA recombination protein RmuC